MVIPLITFVASAHNRLPPKNAFAPEGRQPRGYNKPRASAHEGFALPWVICFWPVRPWVKR